MRLTSIATAIAATFVLTACAGGGTEAPAPTTSNGPVEASPAAYGQRILPTLCDLQVKEQIMLDEAAAPTSRAILEQSITDAATASSAAHTRITSTNAEWPRSAAPQLRTLAEALAARSDTLAGLAESNAAPEAASLTQPAEFEQQTLAARAALELPESMTGGCTTSP